MKRASYRDQRQHSGLRIRSGLADVLYSAMATDAGRAAGMAGQEACSTAGLKVVKIVAEREEIGGQ